MKYTFSLFITLLLMTMPVVSYGLDSGGDTSVEITAEVNKEQINVGDRIKLNIIVENSAGYEVLFPDAPENAGDFSFVGSSSIKMGWRRPGDKGREYVLSMYVTGPHVIPPVQVKYRKKGEEEWRVLESPQVPIEVRSLLEEKSTDIKDLKGLVVFGTGVPWLLILFTLFIVSGAILWIARRGKKWKTVPAAVVTRVAHEIAYEQLRQLKELDLPGHGRVKEYYSRLSDVVRQYLEDRFYFRAPEMTTEEFMMSVKKSPDMRDEHKKLLKNFLFHCDMVKFAKYGPTALEILDSFGSAEHLVDQTKVAEDERVKDRENTNKLRILATKLTKIEDKK